MLAPEARLGTIGKLRIMEAIGRHRGNTRLKIGVKQSREGPASCGPMPIYRYD